MQAPDLHPRPGDRDETLLVVLIALVSLPALGIAWVWLRRADFDLAAAIAGTLDAANDDPLVLATLVDFCLLLATCAVWVWRDGGRRGVGPASRACWVLLTLVLGSLGLWMYLAGRPRHGQER